MKYKNKPTKKQVEATMDFFNPNIISGTESAYIKEPTLLKGLTRAQQVKAYNNRQSREYGPDHTGFLVGQAASLGIPRDRQNDFATYSMGYG